MTTQSPHDDDARARERSRYDVDPPVDPGYDPYRFGAPDQPVPPQYAPPGYRPPANVPPANVPPANVPPPHVPPGDVPPPYGYGPPSPYYGPPPNLQYPPPRAGNGNGKAIAALVLGILSIVFCFASFFDLVLIIPAIVFGSVALNEAKRTHAGRSVAISGLVCAIVGALLAIMITVWLYPKVASCANDYPSGSSEYNTCIRNIVK